MVCGLSRLSLRYVNLLPYISKGLALTRITHFLKLCFSLIGCGPLNLVSPRDGTDAINIGERHWRSSLAATASFFTTGVITAHLLHGDLPAVGTFDWTLGPTGAKYLGYQLLPLAASFLLYTVVSILYLYF